MSGEFRRPAALGKPRPEVTTGENKHRTNSGAEDPGDGIEGVARAARGQGLGCFGGDSDGGHDEHGQPGSTRAADDNRDQERGTTADDGVEQQRLRLAQRQGRADHRNRGGKHTEEQEGTDESAHRREARKRPVRVNRRNATERT
jgi:hypothetical protein